jgi:broad specificity phosphatase PhoE
MQQRIYYVRHGECQLNVERRFAGRQDTPLSELGLRQAETAAANIAAKAIHPDLIVSSPLDRAKQTALIIADRLDYPVDGIAYNDLFIERSFGVLEGTPRQDFFDSYSYRDIDNAPGAETILQLHVRAKQAVDWLYQQEAQSILIVSHSAFYRAFAHALRQDPSVQEYVNPFRLIPNGEVWQLA